MSAFDGKGDKHVYAFGAIVVERRASDWKAYLTSRPHIFGTGGSTRAAVGSLIIGWPDEAAEAIMQSRRAERTEAVPA